MIDRNKVMQALKCCSDLSGKSCAECTYVTDDFCLGNGSPIGQLAHDALELMKEQEPVPVAERWDTGYYYVCGNCGRKFGILAHDPVYCPDCGRKVKWDE